jgi:hypothetical protein
MSVFLIGKLKEERIMTGMTGSYKGIVFGKEITSDSSTASLDLDCLKNYRLDENMDKIHPNMCIYVPNYLYEKATLWADPEFWRKLSVKELYDLNKKEYSKRKYRVIPKRFMLTSDIFKKEY